MDASCCLCGRGRALSDAVSKKKWERLHGLSCATSLQVLERLGSETNVSRPCKKVDIVSLCFSFSSFSCISFMACHIIFGPRKYSFPPERIFQLSREINDPLEILVPPSSMRYRESREALSPSSQIILSSSFYIAPS